MVAIHPVSIVAGTVWLCTVVSAICCSRLSASAGILPKPWMSIGMLFGLLNVVLVIVGVCYLSESFPRLVKHCSYWLAWRAHFGPWACSLERSTH